MKNMEQGTIIHTAIEDQLTEEERNLIARMYEVSDDAKQFINKKNGEIFFKELPIKEWYGITSSKIGDAFSH